MLERSIKRKSLCSVKKNRAYVIKDVHCFNDVNSLDISFNYSHFRLILTPRREVIHSNFKAYEVNADGKEKTVHLGMMQFSKAAKFTDCYIL